MEVNSAMFLNKILNFKQKEAKKNNDNSYKNTMFEDDFDEIL